MFLGELFGIDVSFYKNEAESLKNAIIEHCYDQKDGNFYSVDLNLLPITEFRHKGAPRHWDCVIERIGCWSGFLALWCGIATKEQADRMVKENLLCENGFWAPFGVRSLAKYEKMYSVVPSGNPSCWLGPIWGISNFLVFEGLKNYGFINEAKELAEKTVTLFEKDLQKTGTLHEYYHPETGEPIINPDFQNWNLLSILMKDYLKS